jgi:hypothetical protein
MHKGGEGEEGGTSCTPSKDFEKFYYKNAIKHENRGPPPRFSHNSMYPLKEYENDCASMPTGLLYPSMHKLRTYPKIQQSRTSYFEVPAVEPVLLIR